MKDFARGCMRTDLILNEKADASKPNPLTVPPSPGVV
jgi:hypothetical protein